MKQERATCRTLTRTPCYHRSLGDGHRLHRPPFLWRAHPLLSSQVSSTCDRILPPADSNVVKMIKAEGIYEILYENYFYNILYYCCYILCYIAGSSSIILLFYIYIIYTVYIYIWGLGCATGRYCIAWDLPYAAFQFPVAFLSSSCFSVLNSGKGLNEVFPLLFEVVFVHLPVTERMLLSSFFARAVSTVPILFFFLAMAANSNSCGTVQLEITDRAICSYFVGTGFSRFLFFLYLGRWSTRSSSRCLCTCSGECGDDRRTRIARQTLPIFPLYATPVGITVRPRGVMHENGRFMRFTISIIYYLLEGLSGWLSRN